MRVPRWVRASAANVPSVSSSARYVSVQAGGNDIGFTQVFGLCAQKDNDDECAAAVAQSTAYMNSTFTGQASALFAELGSGPSEFGNQGIRGRVGAILHQRGQRAVRVVPEHQSRSRFQLPFNVFRRGRYRQPEEPPGTGGHGGQLGVRVEHAFQIGNAPRADHRLGAEAPLLRCLVIRGWVACQHAGGHALDHPLQKTV